MRVKNGPKTLKHAFIATMPNGHTDVFERIGSEHKKVKGRSHIHVGFADRELYGPAIPDPEALAAATQIELAAFNGRELIGPDPDDPLGRLLNQHVEEPAIDVRTVLTAQSYHALIALAARSRRVTIVDELSALAAREAGLNVVPLAPEIAIPVVASLAINGERSTLVEEFVNLCREIVHAKQQASR